VAAHRSVEQNSVATTADEFDVWGAIRAALVPAMRMRARRVVRRRDRIIVLTEIAHMPLNSLHDLYVEHIQDLHSAEQQILDALPKMAEKANHSKLRDAFTHHREQTQQHARRLEEIAKRLGISAGGKTCKGMKGLIEEGSEALKEDGDPDVRDAALISAAQRVEHYEIAAYGCARTYANALGLTQDVDVLQRTLDEEGETDKLLTKVAESIVNPDAEQTTGARESTRPQSRSQITPEERAR
jgi:ferritin-like metal-binding protein YciE